METKVIDRPVISPSKLHQLMACPIEVAKPQKTRLPKAINSHSAELHQKKLNFTSSLLISSLSLANLGLFYILLLITS